MPLPLGPSRSGTPSRTSERAASWDVMPSEAPEPLSEPPEPVEPLSEPPEPVEPSAEPSEPPVEPSEPSEPAGLVPGVSPVPSSSSSPPLPAGSNFPVESSTAPPSTIGWWSAYGYSG